MNANENRRYPIDYTDEEINGEILENLDLLAGAERLGIKSMRRYVQITLGQTELQSRSSKKVRRASNFLTRTALALSVLAIIF